MSPGPGRATCAACRDEFRFEPVRGELAPKVCGRFRCQTTLWPLDRWEGQARMADARRAAGVELTDTDREAYRRLGIREDR